MKNKIIKVWRSNYKEIMKTIILVYYPRISAAFGLQNYLNYSIRNKTYVLILGVPLQQLLLIRFHLVGNGFSFHSAVV